VVVKDKEAALTEIKKIIPDGVSIMNGSSVTLEQIGFVEYLKSGKHPWNNLHAAIVAEEDPEKQLALREKAQLSDYYLGSVHALTESGEFLIASNTGSQLPHVVYTSQNLIYVVSTKKIVPTMNDAMKRLTDFVVPREDIHMQEKYGMGTQLNKILMVKGESSFSKRKITFILIEEDLGF
jgi:L-lactate utilization protein LutC